MKKGDIWFWISHQKKNISFQPMEGYEKICVDTYTEMWEKVYAYIDQGYLIQ